MAILTFAEYSKILSMIIKDKIITLTKHSLEKFVWGGHKPKDEVKILNIDGNLIEYEFEGNILYVSKPVLIKNQKKNI